MKIFWMTEATSNIAAAYEFIYESNPAAADRHKKLIFEAVGRLIGFPEMGRAGRIAGTRELAVAGTSYIVVYGIHSRSIAILAVLHGARRWPPTFKN